VFKRRSTGCDLAIEGLFDLLGDYLLTRIMFDPERVGLDTNYCGMEAFTRSLPTLGVLREKNVQS
jgi:hypothetical protein